jgi:hypothetical protein
MASRILSERKSAWHQRNSIAVVETLGMPPLISFIFCCELVKLGFCNGPGVVKGHLSTRESSVPPGVVLQSGVGALAAT